MMGRRGRGAEEEMLARMYEAQMDAAMMAQTYKMSLGALASWAGKRETVRAMRGLRLLADMQTQLVLSRCRITAAAKLVDLASQNDDPELARKACVDLMKLDALPRREKKVVERSRADTPSAAAVDTAAVLTELERMGDADEAEGIDGGKR